MIKKTDIIKFISLIRMTYPNAYPTRSDEEEQMLVELWYSMFREYPRDVVFAGFEKAMKRSEFAPKPATIIAEIEKMRGAYEKDDAELWAELQGVLREVSREAYRFNFTFIEDNGLSQGDNARQRVKEIFENLDPALKDYCRDTRGLIELAKYTDEQTSYERGRFMRVMPTVRERIKTRQEMPDNIRVLIQGIAEKMTMKLDGESTLKLNGGK